MSSPSKRQCRRPSHPDASASMGKKLGFVPAVCIVKRQNHHQAREEEEEGEEEEEEGQRGVDEREGGGRGGGSEVVTAGNVARQAELRRPARGRGSSSARSPPWGSLLSCLSGVWSAGTCCYGCSSSSGGGLLGAHSVDAFHANPNNAVTTWNLVDGGTPC